MCASRSIRSSRWLFLLGIALLGGCPAGVVVGLTIAARTYNLLLSEAGVLKARAGAAAPARAGGVVSLNFDQTPSDNPGSAELRIGSVRVLSLDEAAGKSATAQSLSGSAIVAVHVSAASAANPCEEGVRVGSFRVDFSGGEVTLRNRELAVPAAALPFLISGEFGICFEAVASVDVQIVIESIDCVFGEDVGDGPPVAGNTPDEVPDKHLGGNPGDPNQPGDDPNDPNDDPNDGDPNDDPNDDPNHGDPGGFITAIIRNRGTEQLIAGKNVDPTISFRIDGDYSADDLIFDLRNRSFAMNGSGTRVWVRLFTPFVVQGKPRTQLWCMNTDGSGAQRSFLPEHDLNNGLHLATDRDGLFCFANNTRNGWMYRAQPGQPATEIFNYTGVLDFDVNFAVNRDGSRMYLANLGRFAGLPSIYTVNLNSAPLSPTLIIPQSAMAIQGINPRGLAFMFDLAADSSTYVFRANYDSPTLDPRTQDVLFAGRGFSATTLENVKQTDFRDSPYDLNITDDGQMVAYCTPADSLNAPNEGVVRSLADGSEWKFGDGRTSIGAMKLSDGGNRLYYRSSICCDGGEGVFQDVGTTRKWPVGTQVFGGNAWTDVQISQDGRTLISAIDRGLYCLREGVSPPANLPNIESIAYRFNDDCTLTIRARLYTPRGLARVFVNPYLDGVDPTRAIAGEQNPFFAIRFGGGVNQSTRLQPVEGAPGVWEYTFPLTNSLGQCAGQHLNGSYHLRLVVVDESETTVVYQDFRVRD